MDHSDPYPKVYLYRRVVQAKLFIDQHYAGQIDLNAISDEASFSKFHFIRLFRDSYGKTPHQYLKHVRIEQAKELLKKGMPVSEVCYAVGFDSVSSFSGLFSRTVGSSPSAFMAQYQQMQQKIRQAPLFFVPGCYAYQHGWTE